MNNLLRAGWKAEPSSLPGGGRGLRHRMESRRLSASRGGRAALGAGMRCYFGQLWPKLASTKSARAKR